MSQVSFMLKTINSSYMESINFCITVLVCNNFLGAFLQKYDLELGKRWRGAFTKVWAIFLQLNMVLSPSTSHMNDCLISHDVSWYHYTTMPEADPSRLPQKHVSICGRVQCSTNLKPGWQAPWEICKCNQHITCYFVKNNLCSCTHDEVHRYHHKAVGISMFISCLTILAVMWLQQLNISDIHLTL